MSWEKSNDKRNALEEIFFAKQNRELIEKMKAKTTQLEICQELAKVSGINDQEILDKLYESGIRPSTMLALELLPLILVAWADGEIDEKERNAILKAAVEHGISADNPAYGHLESWLKQSPPLKTFETWKSYVEGLSKTLGRHAFHQLQTSIMDRTRAVANAAGGFLGLGSKISDAENIMLEKLETVFKSSLRSI